MCEASPAGTHTATLKGLNIGVLIRLEDGMKGF